MHSCYVATQIVLLCNTTAMVNGGVCVGRHVILNEVNDLAVLCGCHPAPKAEVLIVLWTNVILNHVLNWVQDLMLHIWIPEQVRNDGRGTIDSASSTEWHKCIIQFFEEESHGINCNTFIMCFLSRINHNHLWILYAIFIKRWIYKTGIKRCYYWHSWPLDAITVTIQIIPYLCTDITYRWNSHPSAII